MGNYYEYRSVKVEIAHKLMAMDGWKVYGYYPDESDSMTDYYSPAHWDGIAEKNGYILCVDVYGAAKPYEIKKYNYSNSAPDKNTQEKIKKLECVTVARGATESEEVTAKEKIDLLLSKNDPATKDSYTVIGVVPGHMAHPTRCNWHIEKDGVIIEKGNGLLKFTNLDRYYNREQNETKETIRENLKQYYNNETDLQKAIDYRWNELLETKKLRKDFDSFINKIDTACGGLLGSGEGYVYEKVTVTEYKNEIKAVETTEGSIKEGQCFILKVSFNYGRNKGYVYRIHETEYNGKKLYHANKLNGKKTKECTGTADSSNTWYLTDNFIRWFERGSIAFCELQEVKTPYEVEKVVKKKISNEKESKQNKEAAQEPEQESNEKSNCNQEVNIQPEVIQEETNTTDQPIERKYYSINEQTARTAKNVNSFSDYTENEATNIYKNYCDDVYNTLQKIIDSKPELKEKAANMVDYYCKKLAEYYNDYYRNEASCPSVLICGAGNFPTKKKNKQNSRRETLHNTWKYLDDYKHKIDSLLKQDQPILSNNKNAIQLLEEKIEKLESEHKHKLYCNNYYKQHKTLKGCEGLTEEQITEIESFINRNPFFPPFIVVNDTANIRRYKDRLESLKNAKQEPQEETTQEENELFKVVKNTELMRLQLLFDGKPEQEVRDILKKNGFKWSPTNAAWQRQLTENALYSLEKVKQSLEKIS